MQRECHAPIANALPNWVPQAARNYLAHTESGLSIRQLAREAGLHASTVLRQVRRLESRRDDPLVDAVLRRLGSVHYGHRSCNDTKDTRKMAAPQSDPIDPDRLKTEAARVLRRLCEPRTVLAVAADMDKAVVVRDAPDGNGARTAVVAAEIAQAMALQDWIACDKPGRISRYRITAAGRTRLEGWLGANGPQARAGFAEAPAGFAGARPARDTVEEAGPTRRRVRYSMAESPLMGLARRRDRDGRPFLSAELVAAGERLREDFELAHVGPGTTTNWDSFLTGPAPRRAGAGEAASGPMAARARVEAALAELGPGLADVALRCCCRLEGLEVAEKRMGWSARSGKIVLRIALQRLRRHYDLAGRDGLIG